MIILLLINSYVQAEFVVRFTGSPLPKIAWFKDGFEIFSSRRTRIITESGKSVLLIHQTALNDEGEIKCTATNRAGHASTKARLILEGLRIFNFWISHSMIIKISNNILYFLSPQHPQRYDFRVNTRTAFSSSKTKRLDWRCRWLEDLHPLWFGTTMARWSQATKGTSSSRWMANRSWRYPMPNESTEENTWSKR